SLPPRLSSPSSRSVLRDPPPLPSFPTRRSSDLDAVLGQVAGEDVEDPHAARVIRFFRVQRDGRMVGDSELRGAEPFPAEQAVEVVDERIHARAGLPEPKGGLNEGLDPCGSEGFVIVRRAGCHVDVRVEDSHVSAPNRGGQTSAEPPAAATSGYCSRTSGK